MRFNVDHIRDRKVVEQEETVSAQDIIGTPPAFVNFRHPVKSKVSARMTGEAEVVFMGKIATIVTYQCGRCLEFFEKPMNLDFQQVVTTTEELEIDINGEIRESLLIDLPVRAICKESCQGICVSCGKNKNTATCTCEPAPTDPRWNALKEFPFK